MNFSGCFTQNGVVQCSPTTIPTRPSCSSGSQLSETTSIIQIGPTQPKLWKIPWQLFYLDILAHSQRTWGSLCVVSRALDPFGPPDLDHTCTMGVLAHSHRKIFTNHQLARTGHIYQVVLDVLGHNSATMGLICQLLLADYQCQDQDASCDTFG